MKSSSLATSQAQPIDEPLAEYAEVQVCTDAPNSFLFVHNEVAEKNFTCSLTVNEDGE